MNQLNAGTRIGTMALDHIAMTFVMMIFVAPEMVYDIIQTFGNNEAPPKLFLGNYYVNVFAFSLYFNKDIYLGRSFAKRMLKLQLVDIKTNKPANPLKCLLRNLTTILWPIEVIAALVNNERRIGDYIAGTKLTTFEPEQHQEQFSFPLAAIAVVASMAFTYLTIFLPLEVLLMSPAVAIGPQS